MLFEFAVSKNYTLLLFALSLYMVSLSSNAEPHSFQEIKYFLVQNNPDIVPKRDVSLNYFAY